MIPTNLPAHCPRRMRPVEKDGKQIIPVEGDPNGRVVRFTSRKKIGTGRSRSECAVNRIIQECRKARPGYWASGGGSCGDCDQDYEYYTPDPTKEK